MTQTAAVASPVDTKAVQRRDLRFGDFEQVNADLDRLEAALDAGTLTHTGNWTPGENFDHLAKFLRFALDGFSSKAPAPVRWIARMMFKKKATSSEEPIPAGFKLPKQASVLLPEPGVEDREGLQRLRTQVARILSGEQMTHPSPLFGSLTHEEWLTLQRKHMALHLSFLHPGA